MLTLRCVLQIIRIEQDWSSRLNSIALACMSNARRFFTWSLLAVYLGVSLFGELVHLSQCASCLHAESVKSSCAECACHGHSPFFARREKIRQANKQQLPATAGKAFFAGDECRAAENSADPKSSVPSHDSKSCAVCKILAIARDRAPSLTAVAGLTSMPETLILSQESVAGFTLRETQSRGPPQV